MKKRLAALSCLLFLFLAMGCGSKEKEEVTEITLMHGWGGTLKTHAIMQQIYDEFSEQNTDIKLVSYPSSDSSVAVEKANDMLAVGKMPDILSTNGDSYYVSNAIKRGMALDLMSYIEKDPELKQSIHPSVFDEWKNDKGELYTVPDSLEIAGYWYNKEYFIESGIVDENGEPDLPSTWEEFFADCAILKKWGEQEKEAFHVMSLDNEQLVKNFFFARLGGSKDVGLELTQQVPTDFDQQPFYRTLKDVQRLGEYANTADNITNARQSFLDGKTAMYFNGVWESEPLSTSQIGSKVGYANYPTEEGKSLAYISPSSGYVFYKNPDPKKVDASIRFLKYMLSEEVQKKLALLTGQAPSNANVLGDEITKGSPMLGNALEIANEADIQIVGLGASWEGGSIEILTRRLMDVVQGEVTPKELIYSLNQ